MNSIKNQIYGFKEFKDSIINSIEEVYHGTINQNFVVNTTQGKYFVRINNPLVAGVNRKIEAFILDKLCDLGITPKIITNNVNDGYLILEYLPLQNWTPNNCLNNQQLLLNHLSIIHQVELPKEFPTLLSRLNDYESQTKEDCSQGFLTTYHSSKQKLIDLGFFENNKLVHFDLNSKNLLGVDPLYIIDWEFAGVAHPIFDLALFIFNNGLSLEQCPLIIEYCKNYENGEEMLVFSIRLAKEMTQMWEMIQNKSSPEST
jgi:thiamine kinase-like enzyme